VPESYDEQLRQARAEVPEVTTADTADRLRAGGMTLVDVREQHEWDAGHLAEAVLVPKSRLEASVEAAVPDRTAPLILYCGVGQRSLFAARTLREMGYADVVSMAGGIEQWAREGRPIVDPGGLSDVQRQRYSRHLLIPEVGPDGQVRLLGSKVLLVGAGGLGSPAALYLAAAGVGTLGIVDFDTVDLSNLQRVVLDGTDSFETRYLLNDAAVIAGIPVVHASVYRFEGQLTVFDPPDGPCYRCLYPTPPPPELAPACSVAGVLGVVPGIMGLLQANEVLKLLLGIGSTLAGRLVLYDALEGEFTELRLRRDPACPVCSEAAVEARAAGTPLPLPVPVPAADGGVFTLGAARPA
jgi:molybdopterin/thiamine biosynthesis adenylyltransferase/rhodanese-related sulfurtransferase